MLGKRGKRQEVHAVHGFAWTYFLQAKWRVPIQCKWKCSSERKMRTILPQSNRTSGRNTMIVTTSRQNTSRSSTLIITCTLHRVQIPTPVSALVWTCCSLIGVLWLWPLEPYGAYLTLSDMQTFRLLLAWLLRITGALHMLCWALSMMLIYTRDRGRSAILHTYSSASLPLNSRGFSTLASAREKSGSFYYFHHIADTFSGSKMIQHMLSWQMGFKKTPFSALQPLRRKVSCGMYTQNGVTMPGAAIGCAGQSLLQASQHLNFRGGAC